MIVRDASRGALSVLAVALASFAPAGVGAQPPAHPESLRALEQDSLLVQLVGEALERRPELAQARALAQAEKQRAPQAGALPDPVVSLGIQNDGFGRLRIGEMETSWWSIGAAQTVPMLGKRGLRARAQTLAARQSDADLERATLTARAEVERAYVDLLLVRDQLRILGEIEALWTQAEGTSRARYESGAGAQSDVLRAQLERIRLRQRRLTLAAEERRGVVALNRAVGRPLEQDAPTSLSLAELRDPTIPDSMQAEAAIASRSPELLKARLAIDQSSALVSLARRDYFPDLTLSGGVMPRGGAFETMWQAGVSFPVPLWAAGKQSRAVRESRLRGEAARGGAEAIRRLARQRLEERRALLGALIEANRIYRSGLLVQSEATVSSAMAQYEVGKTSFVSVLESLDGRLADVVGFYQSVAAAQRIDIAQRELSLDPVDGSPIGGGAASMPGAAGMNGVAAPAAGSPPPPAAGAGPAAMPRM